MAVNIFIIFYAQTFLYVNLDSDELDLSDEIVLTSPVVNQNGICNTNLHFLFLFIKFFFLSKNNCVLAYIKCKTFERIRSSSAKHEIVMQTDVIITVELLQQNGIVIIMQ